MEWNHGIVREREDRGSLTRLDRNKRCYKDKKHDRQTDRQIH